MLHRALSSPIQGAEETREILAETAEMERNFFKAKTQRFHRRDGPPGYQSSFSLCRRMSAEWSALLASSHCR